jgi:CheY-like chemotaxis protein
LRAGRFVLDFALSADEALRKIAEVDGTSLILLVSDINMPGMSGLDLLPRVKQVRPDLPVLMITAYGDPDTRRVALERGADGFLTKPIDFTALRAEIDTASAQPRPHDEILMSKILVVDDEPDLEALVVQKFRRQIREGEVSFLFAHDGVEAFEMLGQHPDIDMVLSDINMPRMDGLSLLARIQEDGGEALDRDRLGLW